MNNQTHHSRPFALFAVLAASLLLTAGCNTLDTLPAKLQKFDELGITELRIPGRITSTDYVRVEKDGVITSTLTHSNPGLAGPIKVVRERPAAK